MTISNINLCFNFLLNINLTVLIFLHGTLESGTSIKECLINEAL